VEHSFFDSIENNQSRQLTLEFKMIINPIIKYCFEINF